MTTLHLTLKMTTTQVVETSVTNNSFSEDYPHLDYHALNIKNLKKAQVKFDHYINICTKGNDGYPLYTNFQMRACYSIK